LYFERKGSWRGCLGRQEFTVSVIVSQDQGFLKERYRGCDLNGASPFRVTGIDRRPLARRPEHLQFFAI
jgi:hypothetical protein